MSNNSWTDNGWTNSEDRMPKDPDYPILCYFMTDTLNYSATKGKGVRGIFRREIDSKPIGYKQFYWISAESPNPLSLPRIPIVDEEADAVYLAVQDEREEIAKLVSALYACSNYTKPELERKAMQHNEALEKLRDRLGIYL